VRNKGGAWENEDDKKGNWGSATKSSGEKKKKTYYWKRVDPVESAKKSKKKAGRGWGEGVFMQGGCGKREVQWVLRFLIGRTRKGHLGEKKP